MSDEKNKMEKLLVEVKGIVDKYKRIDAETGQNFNIFKVLEVNEKEVLICRFIYQLINPQGLHNQNEKFLKKFVEDVLDIDIDNEELKTARVNKELLIKDDRRIDLVIETDKRVIPIEVKIYAGDENDQCKDYLDWAKQKGKEDYILYYLTLDGHYPRENSFVYRKDLKEYKDDSEIYAELGSKKVKCISFEDKIIKWIKNCLEDVSILDKKQIVDNLLQFLKTIKELCNMENDKIVQEAKELLEKDSDNFRAYLTMKESEIEIKKEVVKDIIDRINDWINENKYDADKVYCDKRDNDIDKLCKGYGISDDNPVGVGILLKKQIEDIDIEFSLFFEVCKYKMLCGLSIKDENKRKKYIDRIREMLKIDEENKDFYCVCVKKITTKNGESPNICIPNESFLELLNTDYRKEFIKGIIQNIQDLVYKLNKI